MRRKASLAFALLFASTGCMSGAFGPDMGRPEPRHWVLIRHWPASPDAGPLAGDKAAPSRGSGAFRVSASARPTEGGRSIMLRPGDTGLLRGMGDSDSFEFKARKIDSGRVEIALRRAGDESAPSFDFSVLDGQTALVADGVTGLRVFVRVVR